MTSSPFLRTKKRMTNVSRKLATPLSTLGMAAARRFTAPAKLVVSDSLMRRCAPGKLASSQPWNFDEGQVQKPSSCRDAMNELDGLRGKSNSDEGRGSREADHARHREGESRLALPTAEEPPEPAIERE